MGRRRMHGRRGRRSIHECHHHPRLCPGRSRRNRRGLVVDRRERLFESDRRLRRLRPRCLHLPESVAIFLLCRLRRRGELRIRQWWERIFRPLAVRLIQGVKRVESHHVFLHEVRVRRKTRFRSLWGAGAVAAEITPLSSARLGGLLFGAVMPPSVGRP